MQTKPAGKDKVRPDLSLKLTRVLRRGRHRQDFTAAVDGAGVAGDDGADALRHRVATKGRAIMQQKLRELWLATRDRR
jgi:hypothetical protein